MKTWFITGASRGFGRRIAQIALTQGDNVVATARNVEAAAEELGAHPNLLVVPLDVTSDEQARDAAARGVSRLSAAPHSSLRSSVTQRCWLARNSCNSSCRHIRQTQWHTDSGSARGGASYKRGRALPIALITSCDKAITLHCPSLQPQEKTK
jgi:hypothetical protein